jgi:hypothetical protein
VTYELVETEMCGTTDNLENTLSGAFLAAHLLTGSASQAEAAVQEAIESWDPDDDTEEKLFQLVLKGAVRVPAEWAVLNWTETGSSLPTELQAVLRLSSRFRQCFVLRILLRLSREESGRLLGVGLDRVDEYTCASLRSLAELSTAGLEQLTIQQLSWTRTIRWTD